MSKIAIIGDIHSNIDNIYTLIKKHPDVSAIFSTGDLAIFLNERSAQLDKKAIKHTERSIKQHIRALRDKTFVPFSIPIYVLIGNHDDYDNMFCTEFQQANIKYLKQGEIVRIDNLVIMGFGGIYSPKARLIPTANLDRQPRGRRFYTLEEIDGITSRLFVGITNVDVLITHQAAAKAIPLVRFLKGEEGSYDLLSLVRHVSPTYYIHGHHHFEYKHKSAIPDLPNHTTCIGLGNFGKNPETYIVINTITKEIER